MAGIIPAIDALPRCTQDVDARDKPGHDGRFECSNAIDAPALIANAK